MDISVVESLLREIETSSTNQWKGDHPIAILKGLLSEEPEKRLRVTLNTAETRTWKNGAIGTGTLDGTRVEKMRKDNYVGVCFSSFGYKDEYSKLGRFWYPTIVFPERMDGIGKVYITK